MGGLFQGGGIAGPSTGCDTGAVMIEGPSHEAIELVEVK
jgi:hypothetical protein